MPTDTRGLASQSVLYLRSELSSTVPTEDVQDQRFTRVSESSVHVGGHAFGNALDPEEKISARTSSVAWLESFACCDTQ